MKLKSVQADMSDDECNNFNDFFYSSSSEEDISDDGRFEEVILTTISSVVGEMFDGFVTVRVSHILIDIPN